MNFYTATEIFICQWESLGLLHLKALASYPLFERAMWKTLNVQQHKAAWCSKISYQKVLHTVEQCWVKVCRHGTHIQICEFEITTRKPCGLYAFWSSTFSKFYKHVNCICKTFRQNTRNERNILKWEMLVKIYSIFQFCNG